jgi:hypothetical protein
MNRTGTITMSMRELDRIKIIQALVDGDMKPGRAAERLGLTVRQVHRLTRRYQVEGLHGLTSRKRDRPSNNRLPSETARLALTIIRERYTDFGPTLACEKLRERHSLTLAKETVRKLMIEAGLWIPRTLRPPKIYQPRNRRQCLGELVQIDGSEHAWFEDRAPKCTLLVYVDDATSRLLCLHFTPSESTFSYFEATRAYLQQHGKPQTFYSDKAGIFRINQKQTAADSHGYTQFGRALYELNIGIICANSSSAKGRVERAHSTLQDRLVKELRLEQISTIMAANAYAPAFIADYNRRFAKPPRNDLDAHRPVRDDEDLDLIFTWRELRKVSQALTLQYARTMYLLPDIPDMRKLIHKYIDVFEYPDGRIELRADGAALPYTTYDRLPEIDQGAIVENKRLGHVLQVAQLMQQQRDSRRDGPAHTNRGFAPVKHHAAPGTKAQRKIDASDLERAIKQTWH